MAAIENQLSLTLAPGRPDSTGNLVSLADHIHLEDKTTRHKMARPLRAIHQGTYLDMYNYRFYLHQITKWTREAVQLHSLSCWPGARLFSWNYWNCWMAKTHRNPLRVSCCFFWQCTINLTGCLISFVIHLAKIAIKAFSFFWRLLNSWTEWFWSICYEVQF